MKKGFLFRFEEEEIDKLKKDAKQNKTSCNSLVRNRLFPSEEEIKKSNKKIMEGITYDAK